MNMGTGHQSFYLPPNCWSTALGRQLCEQRNVILHHHLLTRSWLCDKMGLFSAVNSMLFCIWKLKPLSPPFSLKWKLFVFKWLQVKYVYKVWSLHAFLGRGNTVFKSWSNRTKGNWASLESVVCINIITVHETIFQIPAMQNIAAILKKTGNRSN